MVAVVLAGAFAIVACFHWDTLRIRHHVAAMQRAGRMLDVLAGAVPQTLSDRVTRILSLDPSNSHWSDSYNHHEDALIRLGYLTRREFPFSRGTFTEDELRTNALPLMSDWTSSCWLSQSQAVVRVVARPTEMSAWAALIGELDRRHKP